MLQDVKIQLILIIRSVGTLQQTDYFTYKDIIKQTKGQDAGKMKKRIKGRQVLALLSMLCLLWLAPEQVMAKEHWPRGPKTESKSVIVMEVNTGTVLYEKKSHKTHYPASITKIMTTLLAIENCDLNEEVTFSDDAVYESRDGSSSISRQTGEKMTMEQCLYAVMLESANECAYAVAEHVGKKLGGNYQTFVDMMNERAKELGCTDTHFKNSNGLPDEEHLVSAYDMAVIAAAAYRNETFRMITGSSSYTIPETNMHDEPFYCHNHHKMVYPWKGDSSYLNDYATGGKTGYTSVANNTLVTYAEKDGITLVCVVMDVPTPGHYTDTEKLINFGFDNFQALLISGNDTEQQSESEKDFGLLNNNGPFAELDENAYIIMPKGTVFTDAKVEGNENQSDGQTVMSLKYTYADHVVGSAAVVKTGAKAEGSYFQNNPGQPEPRDGDIIWIKPQMIVFALFLIVVMVLLIYFGKKFYDNFYFMRHRFEVRRMEHERFRENRRKKRYRKKDRMFR